MKNLLIKSSVSLIVGSLLTAGSAFALPILQDGYDWTSADYWTLTDLAGKQGTFELRYENKNASYESAFGIYAYDSEGTVTAKHRVFDQTLEADFDMYNTPVNTASVFFEIDAGTWMVSSTGVAGSFDPFGDTFGFYFDVFHGGENDTTVDDSWYSDVRLNDGFEHIFIARNELTQDTLIFLEDLRGSGDGNLDMMVSSDDLQPVPEPTTVLLFGVGLAGLAGVTRRQKNKK